MRHLGANFGVKLLLTVSLILSSCTQGSKTSAIPKEQLQNYVSLSFTIKSPEDREKLLKFLTGEAKVRLAAWSDEQFLQAFGESKRSFQKLIIREDKTISPTEVAITYELQYTDTGKNHDSKVTHLKLATFIKQDEKWLIKEVKNLKELIEYSNEMSVP